MSPSKSGVLVLLAVFAVQPAMAYVDPVNGAMLLQLLISGVAGVGLMFRRVIVDFFRRLKARLKIGSHE
jgi:hypothetical protein